MNIFLSVTFLSLAFWASLLTCYTVSSQGLKFAVYSIWCPVKFIAYPQLAVAETAFICSRRLPGIKSLRFVGYLSHFWGGGLFVASFGSWRFGQFLALSTLTVLSTSTNYHYKFRIEMNKLVPLFFVDNFN